MPEKRASRRSSNAGQRPLKAIKDAIRKKRTFLDERLVPAVDCELLLALVRDELPDSIARDVFRFVHLFKSWNDAYCNVLVQEHRAMQKQPRRP
jgi:hypothetical protein